MMAFGAARNPHPLNPGLCWRIIVICIAIFCHRCGKFPAPPTQIVSKSLVLFWHCPCIHPTQSLNMPARLKKGPHGYEILEYLLRNPDAGDSIVGIVEWWLLEQRIMHALEATRKSLDELVARDLLLAYHALDGRVHYSLNKEKQKEIRAMVKAEQKREASGSGST